MKFILIAIIAAVSVNAQLDKLIQKNVDISIKSSSKLLRSTDTTANVLRLWIHLKDSTSLKAVSDSIDLFKRIKIQNTTINVMPIQIVNKNIQTNELRFFKESDKLTAEEIAKDLKKSLPGLKLKNMTSQYRNIKWIQKGHFEIWINRIVL
ncbi:MAG: hypothetical protein JNL74_20955 [Fibrobacteres bacterium]|nr:hypothetical protein [Fibrobacterota bacterium]